MTEHIVDVAILGGGPAGASCGIALRQRGVEACIIDKARFPRNKACAGLVTEKTLRLLEPLVESRPQGTEGLFCDVTSDVSIFNRRERLAHASCEVPYHLAYRREFDSEMVDVYRGLGGLILEGRTPERIDYERRRIYLDGGDTVTYRWLVFADGALSQAHRDFSLERAHDAFCIEAFVAREACDTSEIEMYLGYVDAGYTWVFPHGQRTCVGLINRCEEGYPYREKFDEFLRERGVATEGLRVRGAFVPYGRTVSQDKTPDNVLLVGDAGGFVDPIFGEGLYMALLSGTSAAEALCGLAPKRSFLKAMRPASKMIDSGRKLQSTIFAPAFAERLPDKIRGRDGFLRFYCDEQVSRYHYRYMDPRIVLDYKRGKRG